MAILGRVPIPLDRMGRTQQTFVRGAGDTLESLNSQSGKGPRTGGGLLCTQTSLSVRFYFAPSFSLFVLVPHAILMESHRPLFFCPLLSRVTHYKRKIGRAHV